MSSGAANREATRRELIARGLALRGTRSDRGALRAMLRAEQVLVFTYEQVLASGALQAAATSTVTMFLDHERAHMEALARELRRIGGVPPRAPRGFHGLGALDQAGAIGLLLGLERASISVYYTELAELRDPRLSRTAAEIMANEAQHATELRELLSPGDVARAVPAAFVVGIR